EIRHPEYHRAGASLEEPASIISGSGNVNATDVRLRRSNAGAAQVDDPLVDPCFNFVFEDVAVLQLMPYDLMIYAVVWRDASWRLAA
ncbi:hypothetical protein Taro_005156, partial [Colocasia esculenta]|nr:hypothetical protein [Colocasia esculenta]